MCGFGLSTRETAAAITLIAALLYCGLKLHKDGSFQSTAKKIFGAATAPILIVAYLVMLLGSVIGFTIAGNIKLPFLEAALWTPSMLKDTVLEVLLVGFPALYKGSKAHTIRGVFKRIVLPEISISTMLQAYLNIETFPLLVELVLQAAISVISLILLADPEDEHALRKLCKIISCYIGFGVLVSSTVLIFCHASTIAWLEQLKSILMAAWYPMLLVPLIYSMVLYDAISSAKRRLAVTNQLKKFSPLIIFLLFPSAKAISCFPGKFYSQAKEAETPLQIWVVIRKYRAWLKVRVKEERGKLKLRDHGMNIADKNGIWQNRAGSADTKRYLIDIAIFMGSAWKGGKPPFDRLVDLPYKKPDCVQWSDCKVSESNGHWYAFCLTVSGLCYGVRVSPGDRWPDFYESLPGERTATDLDDLVFQEKRSCPNWSYDDDINMTIAE